jgi:hypothetical protein
MNWDQTEGTEGRWKQSVKEKGEGKADELKRGKP